MRRTKITSGVEGDDIFWVAVALVLLLHYISSRPFGFGQLAKLDVIIRSLIFSCILYITWFNLYFVVA